MKSKTNFGETWVLASILLEKDMNISEIEQELKTSSAKFGYYGFLSRPEGNNLRNWIQKTLDQMAKVGG